jgi:hypothetical protein
MFKVLLKIIFTIILILGLGNYAYYLQTGKTLDIKKTEISEIKLPEIDNILPDTLRPKNKESTLYKWRDENGVIYYTSEKPEEEVRNLEIIKFNHETNVVPSIPTDQTIDKTTSNIETVANPIENIDQLFKQAENVQEQVDERTEAMEDIINY